jgi:L-fucose isomerase-like protein
MEKLKAKLLAFPAADINLFSKAKKKLTGLFHQERVEFVDKVPDILVFLTGGSERIALQSVQEFGFYLLIASSDDNSWAAATEVKAWMNHNNVYSILLDQTNPTTKETVENLFVVKNAIQRLHRQRFGIIGEPSEWLVNSKIDPFIIKTKLGIEQVDIPWSKIDIMAQKDVAADFISFFGGKESFDLLQSGRVYEALAKQIRENNIQAITVECFSLIGACNTTACLALSKLAMDGIPAGCEGDTCSLLGMMLAKEIIGTIPWMANIAHVAEKELLLAHCTVPANLLKGFTLETHFESNKGLAIKGELKGDIVTLFRLDSTLTKAFIGTGKVINQPQSKTACRTQVELEISPTISHYFTNNPLGNHHLVIPGDHCERLKLAAKLLKLELV